MRHTLIRFTSKNTLLLLLFLSFNVFSQTPHLDSLLTALKTMKQDTAKVNLLNSIIRAYIFESNDNYKLYEYTLQQIVLSKKLNFKKGLAYGYTNMAFYQVSISNHKVALDYNLRSLKLMQETKNKKGESSCFVNLGQNYANLGDFTNAVAYMMKGIKLKEELNDIRGVAAGYANLGSAFSAQGKYDEALKYHLKSLKLKEQVDYKPGMVMAYNSIGGILLIQKKLEEALTYFKKSLVLNEEWGNKNMMASNYSNIGDIYFLQNKLDRAYSYQLKSLEIAKSNNDKQGIYTAYSRIGALLEKKKKPAEAIIYYQKMLDLAKQSDLTDGIMSGYKSLSDLYKNKKQFDSAFSYINLYYTLKDTTFNKDNFKQLAELTTRYETDKKEQEIELLTKDQEIKAKIIKQQQLVRWGLIGGVGLLLISIISVFRRYRFKQKANLILEKQKTEISQKNIQITDSIDYAKTIQEAVLPSIAAVSNAYPESFVFYKPKSIVSGDFYWLNKANNQFIFAVADCTGHGVPGAFMSLLGYNMLENVVNKLSTPTLAEILDGLNEEVFARLSKNDQHENVEHGMDISLISIDRDKDLLHFAGAHNSIYVVRDKQLTEIKANKFGIGTKRERNLFTNQTFELKKGDLIYLFTDGFPDQKGGPNSKKFFYPPFKELLTSLSELDMETQQRMLNETHVEWIGDKMDQTDDILIAGIRYS